MFSIYDLKKMYDGNPEGYWFTMDYSDKNPDNWTITAKENGESYKANHLVQLIREDIGQDFELIYDEHVSCRETIRCRKCGTVIFSSYDEFWEPNLCCPTCTDYKTGFEFWTREEIESSEEKQKSLKFLEECRKMEAEAYERRKKRGGKYDWQLWKFKKFFKKHFIILELECDSIMNKFKLKALRLIVTTGDSEWGNDGECLGGVHKHYFTIPLSISYAKLLFTIRKRRKQQKEDIKNVDD